MPCGIRTLSITITAFVVAVIASPALAQSKGQQISADKRRVVEYWTAERRANAIPRDLVIDASGKGHLRGPDGSSRPYGGPSKGSQLESSQAPTAKPPDAGGGGGSDTTPPSISDMVPGEGALIGGTQKFSSVVTDDASGIKSVAFVVIYPDGSTTQSFSPGFEGNDTWSLTLQGFTDGSWSWYVEAKDGAKKGGNTAKSSTVNFTVDTGDGASGGGGDSNHVTTNAAWTSGGVVQTAAGRVYFEMPRNAGRKGPWIAYVCSGTVATDETLGRSIIISAAHCVYDDENKAFARNVLFIPDQDGTTGSGTDTNCFNDPLGCWVASFGVVDENWATRTFPNNIEWDYAYYVVDDTGSHAGTSTDTDILDAEAGSMGVSFTTPYTDDGDPSATSVDFTHALGYSYSDDPYFMFCAEDMTTEGSVNWWLPSCDLSGGSSGGPWVQPIDDSTGDGPIISVNSWGYTNSPGMAGPKLDATSASCLFGEAKSVAFSAIPTIDGDAGLVVNYCP